MKVERSAGTGAPVPEIDQAELECLWRRWPDP
jgi:hypothetical protein